MKTQAEVTAVREFVRKLQESERRLKQEVAELRRRATESERELDEATAKWTISKLLCMKPSREAMQV